MTTGRLTLRGRPLNRWQIKGDSTLSRKYVSFWQTFEEEKKEDGIDDDDDEDNDEIADIKANGGCPCFDSDFYSSNITHFNKARMWKMSGIKFIFGNNARPGNK